MYDFLKTSEIKSGIDIVIYISPSVSQSEKSVDVIVSIYLLSS